MTTPSAAARYEREHVATYRGRETAVYNPQGVPVAQLPIIYGFNNGGSSDFLSAVLLAEDGTLLGGHACSSEAYMLGDLGILEGFRPDRHAEFRERYPDGYRMAFVTYEEVPTHAGLREALRRCDVKHPEGAE